MDRFEIHNADCLEVMQAMEADSIDSIVTDPPYGLSFMGKDWDHGVPGVHFWTEALRVAKPGCHLLAFGGTRTFHRLTCAIEDAGWEIRDCIMWVYGSGFPKSLDVSKAIDKAAGAERTVVGQKMRPDGKAMIDARPNGFDGCHEGYDRPWKHDRAKLELQASITAPATEAARKWQGWGTALKPAWEPVILARKPLDGTVADNVLKHGTGGINIDGCMVGVRASNESGWASTGSHASSNRAMSGANYERAPKSEAGIGRWPANLIHDGSDEVVGGFPHTAPSPKTYTRSASSENINAYGAGIGEPAGAMSVNYGDSGSAARFFYCAKASKRDRDEGCEGFEAIHRANGNKWTDEDYRVKRGERPPSAESGPRRNHHPTVKPTALMRYLCRIVTPPDGIVFDPFMGSGSTGKAAMLEGFRFIGCDIEPGYCKIAEARINHALQESFPLLAAGNE